VSSAMSSAITIVESYNSFDNANTFMLNIMIWMPCWSWKIPYFANPVVKGCVLFIASKLKPLAFSVNVSTDLRLLIFTSI